MMQSDDVQSGAGPDAPSGEVPPPVSPPPAGAADEVSAEGPEPQPDGPSSSWRSRRNLIGIGAAVVVLLLLGWLLIGGGGDDFSLERNELLLLTSSRSDDRVDVYVVALDEEPSSENRVLRDVRLRRIDIPDSVEIAATNFLGLPVRDGFLVHVETRDGDSAVLFVGTDGEDSVIELFDSRRSLEVVYAPGGDRLLIVESGDSTDRCYLGGARDPASRIGGGDTCWLGLDGTVAIADLADGVFDIEFHDIASEDVTRLTVDDVADADGSIGMLSWMTGLWGAPTFFAYVAEEGRDGRALVHLDPRTGEEIYRSATFGPEDGWLLAGGLRIGAVLRDEYVTVELFATDDGVLTPVDDAPVVFADTLLSGDILYAVGERADGLLGWRERSLDLQLYRPGADEPELIAERVGEWFVLDAGDEVELLLLDDRDAVLVELDSDVRREVLDTRDLGEVINVLRHVEGGLYVSSIDDEGWRIDRVDGEEPWEFISRWDSVTAFHVDTGSGWHVVRGREASGDDVTLAVAQQGDRRVQRVDRAENIGALYVVGPGRLLYSASTVRDEEVRELDIREGESTTLHRGYAIAAAGLPRSSDGFFLGGSLPQQAEAQLFEECAENLRGTITGAEQIELTFEPGERAACWRWDTTGLDEPIAWLHAGELQGSLVAADPWNAFRWSTESFSLNSVLLSGTLLEAPGLSEDDGPWFLYVEPYDVTTRLSTTLETGDASRGRPTTHLFPFAPGCDPDVGTERAAECLLETLRVAVDGLGGGDWASLEPAMPSLRSLLYLAPERIVDRFADLLEQQPDLEFFGCQSAIRLGSGQSCFFTNPVSGEEDVIDPSGVIEVGVDGSAFAQYRFNRILKW